MMADQISSVPNGQIQANTAWSEYQQISFAIAQAIVKMQTTTLVQIVSCTNNGGLSPVGFVDVIPMVHQVDSQGIAWPHTTIYNIPYCRIQGGTNAIIIDPQPGDIGMCCFASRDITKVKNTKAPALPGSKRQYNFSDGIYLGGLLNAVPVQFVQFNTAGITVTSPTAVTVNAPTATVNAPTTVVNSTTTTVNSTTTTVNATNFIVNATSTFNGDMAINGAISQGAGGSGATATLIGPVTVTNNVTAAGIGLSTHKHTGVTTGGGTSGGPTP